VNDLLDLFPLDSKESKDTDLDGIGNSIDDDDDNDGILDADEQMNGTDPEKDDSDEDGLKDAVEQENGTDPINSDTDGDGRIDGEDSEPLIPQNQWVKRAVQFGALISFGISIVFFILYLSKRR